MSIKNRCHALAVAFILGIVPCCAAESYLDKLASGYYLVADMRNPGFAAAANTASPTRIAPVIKRIELLAAASQARGLVVYDRVFSDLSAGDFRNVAVFPSPYTNISDTRAALPDTAVRYAKIYLYGVRFPVIADNFNLSGETESEEDFFLFYNTTSIGGILFSKGDTAALHRQNNRVEFFDTMAGSAAAPLAVVPVAKRTLTLTGGDDEYGHYRIVPVEGIDPAVNKVLLLRVVFDVREAFFWSDVLSGAGTFDGASQDVFNWQLGFPVTRLEISEM